MRHFKQILTLFAGACATWFQNLPWVYFITSLIRLTTNALTVMLDAWCLMLDAWCKMFDAWCLLPQPWCLMLDARCLILDVCFMVHDSWLKSHGSWLMAKGNRPAPGRPGVGAPVWPGPVAPLGSGSGWFSLAMSHQPWTLSHESPRLHQASSIEQQASRSEH